MKNPIFKVKLLQEKVVAGRREMAHSIRLEKFYHNKDTCFVSDYLKEAEKQSNY